MTEILSIKGLTKTFGKLIAVNNLDLTVEEGQVYGILGPNGSGKTTTLGMILDVVAPSGGRFDWFGSMSSVQARKQIGAILETPCFYPYLTAVQNLRITAHIKGQSNDRIDPILKQVDLFERKDDKFKTYSLGMKQRLSIAAALLADPPVLILDEPTNGLDPEGIAEIRQLIRDIAKDGKTIIIASHLLDEVQKVCTHFCVLRKGIKLHEGPIQQILGDTNVVELAAEEKDKTRLIEILKSYDGIASLEEENGEVIVSLKKGKFAGDINQYCFDKGLVIKKLKTRRKSLEQEFLKILKEK